MPVRAEDLVCGEQLVNSVGQSLHVISLNPCKEFLVHEVETEAGTVLVNGVLVMATSVEVVKGVVVEELSSLMGLSLEGLPQRLVSESAKTARQWKGVCVCVPKWN